VTTTLYRLYARSGTLLYIGIANRVLRRLSEHAREKPWWGEVANITFETHPDRQAAENAERAAIQSEQPRYNIVHSTLVVAPQPIAALEWHCEVCDLPIADDRGHIWIDLTDIYRAEEQDRETESRDTLRCYKISELPDVVHWHAHHNACDPEPNSNSYDIAIERIRTITDLLAWTAHLIESKRWLPITDWDRMLTTAAAQMAGLERSKVVHIRAI
jgi:predicted GIY-YIG superfamily endonuclease